MWPIRSLPRLVCVCGVVAALSVGAFAGPIDPPGDVKPTLKPLAEVEPRVALSGENTPGDPKSVYRITQSGSYYLTGNVSGGNSLTAITIAADDVTIDLMGFTLKGTPTSGGGVRVEGTRSGILVRNGVIREWPVAGIDLRGAAPGSGHVVEDVRCIGNGGNGVAVGDRSIVRGCIATGNSGVGVLAGLGARVDACTVDASGEAGISVDDRGVVTGCISTASGGDGIVAGDHAIVSGCTASGGLADGFSVGLFTLVRDCVAVENDATGIVGSTGQVIDCTVRDSGNIGIAISGGVVRACTVSFSGSSGISFGTRGTIVDNFVSSSGVTVTTAAGIRSSGFSGRVEGNTVQASPRGYDMSGLSNVIRRNTATGNGTNWVIAPGNICLIVDAVGTSVQINGDAGGVSPGSTHPDVNYSF